MAKRTDANQAEITAALRQVGAGVLVLSEVGHGVPDLLAVFRQRLFLLECKTAKGKLTPDEAEWHARWPGVVHIVRDSREALAAVGAEWSE